MCSGEWLEIGAPAWLCFSYLLYSWGSLSLSNKINFLFDGVRWFAISGCSLPFLSNGWNFLHNCVFSLFYTASRVSLFFFSKIITSLFFFFGRKGACFDFWFSFSWKKRKGALWLAIFGKASPTAPKILNFRVTTGEFLGVGLPVLRSNRCPSHEWSRLQTRQSSGRCG